MTAVKKYALLPLCGLTLFCARAQNRVRPQSGSSAYFFTAVMAAIGV